MSVYVDKATNGFRGMIMCHMIADTFEELHAMADVIGLQRRWFQASPPASFPHYDISLSKRALALKAGAIEVDRNELVAHMARLRPLFGIYGLGNPAPSKEVERLRAGHDEASRHTAEWQRQYAMEHARRIDAEKEAAWAKERALPPGIPHSGETWGDTATAQAEGLRAECETEKAEKMRYMGWYYKSVDEARALTADRDKLRAVLERATREWASYRTGHDVASEEDRAIIAEIRKEAGL